MKIIFEPGDKIQLKDDISLSLYPTYVVKLIKKLDNTNWNAQVWGDTYGDELDKNKKENIIVSEEAFNIPYFY